MIISFLPTLNSADVSIWLVKIGFVSGLLLPILWVNLIYPISSFPIKFFLKPKDILVEIVFGVRSLLSLHIGIIVGFLFSDFQFALKFALISLSQFGMTLFIFQKIGSVAILWRTGKKGNRMRSLAKETGAVVIPIGSVPIQVKTIASAIFNSILVLVFIQSFDEIYGIFTLIAIILIYNGITHLKPIDFIENHAFFDEYFIPSKQSDFQKPVQNEALYWIPKKWKTDIRFLLTMHYRRQSISRLIVLFAIIYFLTALIPSLFAFRIYFLILTLIFWIIESFILFHNSLGSNTYWSFGWTFSSMFPIHFFTLIRWAPILTLLIFIESSDKELIHFLFLFSQVILIQGILSSLAVSFQLKLKKQLYG